MLRRHGALFLLPAARTSGASEGVLLKAKRQECPEREQTPHPAQRYGGDHIDGGDSLDYYATRGSPEKGQLSRGQTRTGMNLCWYELHELRG